MSRDRDPYKRTLDLLRQRLRAGEFGEGQPLQIQQLAVDLGVSSTPVREALSRLLGQGLIERTTGGYRSARYDAAGLGDLYGLDEVYARVALTPVVRRLHPVARAPLGDRSQGQGGHLARTEAWLARLGVGGGEALRVARSHLWDRLAPFRSAEVRVFDDLEREAGELAHAIETKTRAEVQAQARLYFRRRQRFSHEILGAFRALKYHPDIP